MGVRLNLIIAQEGISLNAHREKRLLLPHFCSLVLVVVSCARFRSQVALSAASYSPSTTECLYNMPLQYAYAQVQCCEFKSAVVLSVDDAVDRAIYERILAQPSRDCNVASPCKK